MCFISDSTFLKPRNGHTTLCNRSENQMPDEATQPATTPDPNEPLRERAADWVQRIWRPVGTGIAVILALMLTWHVVHGKHGLSVWHQERAEDKTLRKQIQDLKAENAAMKDRIEHLKSDPDAIEREAREKLHYAKPGEVIYALPATPQQQPAK
jgi:cell division protein FtsB